ncbi:MAG: methyltransferase domain-containing protein [Solirubrobacterales bacterium]|nr:methyltransferase domain-containing protein [Solirubrobacterales bacterium]
MASARHPQRTRAYGQGRAPTAVDRLGVWLSGAAVRRHADLRGKRLGDLGCGFEATLARGALEVVDGAVLVDLALADDLKRDPRVRAIEGPLPESLGSLESDALDVVACLSVLEHVTEPQRLLDEIHRLLAPGGVALINVPTWLGKAFLELSAFRLGLSPKEEMNDHKRYYDPRDLWPMLVDAGFRPSEIRCRRHKLGLNTFAVCRLPGAPR